MSSGISRYRLPFGVLSGVVAVVAVALWLSTDYHRGQLRRFRSLSRLDKAYQYRSSGRLEDSRVELETALAIDARNAKARAEAMVLCYELGDDPCVAEHASEILRRDGRDRDALLFRALSRQRAGQGHLALEDFLAVVKHRDLSGEQRRMALVAVSDLAFAQERYSEALAALDLLEEGTPGADVPFRRGLVLAAQRRPREAFAVFSQGGRSDAPQDVRLRAWRAAATVARAVKDWKRAEQALTSAHHLVPADPQVLRELAYVAYAKGHPQGAIAWLERVPVGLRNSNDGGFLANLYWRVGRYAAAARQYAHLAWTCTSPAACAHALTGLGRAHVQAGELRSGVSALVRAWDAGRRDSPAPLVEAICALAHEGATAEAAALVRSHWAWLAPGESGAPLGTHDCMRLAHVLASAGEHELAAALLRALVSADGLASEMRAQIWRSLGTIASKLPDPLGAAVAFSQGWRSSGDADLLLAAVDVLQGHGETEEAIRLLRVAIPEVSTRVAGAFHARLGYLYQQAGAHDASAVSFGSAVEVLPDDCDLLAAAGRIHVEVGQPQVAVDYLRRAAHCAPSVEIRRSLSVAYERAGDLGQAYSVLLPTVEDSGASPASLAQTWRRMADLAWANGDGVDAGRLYALAASVADGPRVELWLKSADSYYAAGAWARASEAAEAALRHARRDSAAAVKARVILGYSFLRQERLGIAVDALSSAASALLARSADRDRAQAARLCTDIGDLQRRRGRRGVAARWLRRAVDASLPLGADIRAQEGLDDTTMMRLRSSIEQLEDGVALDAYFSYSARMLGEHAAGGVLSLVHAPAQGGMQVTYSPVSLSDNAQRQLQAYARAIWNVPQLGTFEQSSVQVGLGVRCKLLRDADLWASVEKPFGDFGPLPVDALLRLQYLRTTEDEATRRGLASPYARLYLEADVILPRNVTAVAHLEARRGITLTLFEGVVVSPHLVVNGRYRKGPVSLATSVAAAGVGASVRGMPRGAAGTQNLGKVELLAQYRLGAVHRPSRERVLAMYHGGMATVLLHF